MKNWYLKWKLRRQKLRAIFEIEQDLNYIRVFKKDILEFDESKARKRMKELNQKGDQRTPHENAELDAVLQCIAESKAVKNEYEKSTALLKDIYNYVSLL